MADEQELAALREQVARGHAAVARGRWDAALADLGGALPRLRALLGQDHPEVEELVDDLEAVRQMRDVHGFGRTMGFRDWQGPDGDDGEPG